MFDYCECIVATEVILNVKGVKVIQNLDLIILEGMSCMGRKLFEFKCIRG